MIGDLPYTDPETACRTVLHYLKDIPAWPQISKRSFLENMYVQFSEGFPGIVVQDGKIYVDRTRDLNEPLEKLYQAYLENDYTKFPISQDYAAGLHQFLTYGGLPVKAVKGQVTGPVSWGMTVVDSDGKAIAYDETLSDAAAKLLKLKAAWMEAELRKISPNTIIFVDEPSLHSIGSAFFNLNNEKTINLIQEVFSSIRGLKGLHCCGKSDWSVLLKTRPDILSFDAYNYAESLTLYPKEVTRFIADGGVIAWGIVPNQADTLNKESLGSLMDRLGEAIAPFTRKGFDIPFRQLIAQSLLTPSCAFTSLTPEGADRALELLTDLSQKVRTRWG
jgi:methionine synthase II (cobalamin-independent)